MYAKIIEMHVKIVGKIPCNRGVHRNVCIVDLLSLGAN